MRGEKMTVLFPSGYINKNLVDEEFQKEYEVAIGQGISKKEAEAETEFCSSLFLTYSLKYFTQRKKQI